MLELLLVLVFFGLLLMVITYFSRKNKPEEVEVKVHIDEECCGAHKVCDRDSLLSTNEDLVYFDDEELDVLAHIKPEKMTEKQIEQIRDVFYTLNENDVAPWLRSLHARSILLPIDIREEALLIVSERRS